MKRFIAIYGGTSLTKAEAGFVEDLSYALLAHSDIILVTGGFRYAAREPDAISTDVCVCKGAERFTSEKNIPLSDRFETWLPDPEMDRKNEGVERFKKGRVKELKAETPEARRFILVKEVDALITVKGKKMTSSVLNFALAMNKPSLPLAFTGGDSLEYWQDYSAQVKQWFGIDDAFAKKFENIVLEDLNESARNELIKKVIELIDTGLKAEFINKKKYIKNLREWDAEGSIKKSVVQEEQAPYTIQPGSENTVAQPKQFKFFLSYSHKDEALREQLDNHLTALKRHDKLIAVWNDRKIGGGNNWDEKIKMELERADVILLLISSDFMASDYIWRVELASAFERYKLGKVRVIPIFLRWCDFKGAPFEKIQGYPKDAKPVMSFPERQQDEAFYQIVTGIRSDLQRWTEEI